MERGQFTFYRSFWDAMKALPKKDRLPFVTAICEYAFDDGFAPPSGAAGASFLLVKPILDKARKKAENGKQGGSKTKSNKKQILNEKEVEKEIEIEKEMEVETEVENECYIGHDTHTAVLSPDPVATVLSDYLNRINPTASSSSLDELRGYAEDMGPDVCKRAFDIALDAKKPTWPYIRAILRDKLQRGVKCLADWDALETEREKKKPGRKNEPHDYGDPEDFYR